MTRPEPFYFNPLADGLEVFLGPTEARLMELAWEHDELTVKRALFFLGDESKRAYTTVMTVMNRLYRKGLLSRRKEGRSFTYAAAVSRDQFLRERTGMVMRCMKEHFGDYC